MILFPSVNFIAAASDQYSRKSLAKSQNRKMTRTTANLPYGQRISKLCFRCDSCFAFYENSFTDSIKSSCRISSPTIILNKNGNLWKYSGTALTNHFGHEIRNHPARSGMHVTFPILPFPDSLQSADKNIDANPASEQRKYD